jgi:hypothetical protein
MSPITLKPIFPLLVLPAINAAFPSLLPRQSPPPDSCAFNDKGARSWQTTPAQCTSAAQSLCGQIPSGGWQKNGWTTVNSGTRDSDCRVMVYHTDKMNVPSLSDCMNTFNNIVNTCIVSKPGKTDGGGANEGSGGSPSEVAKVQSQMVYQIGVGGDLDFSAQIDAAYTGAYASQEGAAAHVTGP